MKLSGNFARKHPNIEEFALPTAGRKAVIQ
jgi:hypothetical protein